MKVEKSLEYERRVKALRKRLALDFQPLKDTLSRGLDVLVDPEAAVYCTSTVEAMCEALFNVIIKNLHDEAATSMAPLDTKVTIFHIQFALRSHPDFALVLQNVDSATIVLEYFMDDATSKALYQRELIATREAKHLRPTAEENEEELIRMHERTRSEWQKREDDPFNEVDFATVLKCVHPAFTLSYNATMLLSALVRELLNEVCDVANIESIQQRVPPELYLEDIEVPLARVFFHAGEIGKQIAKTALDCLERFRLKSRKGSTLTIRFRVYPGANASANHRLTTQHMLNNVPRDALFGHLHPQMCKKCHLDPTSMALIYRGHQLEAATTPASLSMPTGAIVYLVSKKWWDHTRRNEARRGLMTSIRRQDALIKSLVEGSESKVKRDFHERTSPTGPTPSNPFGHLGAAASPAAVMVRREAADAGGRSNSVKKTLAKQHTHAMHAMSSNAEPEMDGMMIKGHRSVHQRSNNSLGGHASSSTSLHSGSPPRGKQGTGGVSSLTMDDAADTQDDDSLSLLLKERTRLRHAMGKQQSNNSEEPAVDAAAPAPLEPHALMRVLATKSEQLMLTLDEAWLGFAGISGGVRSMKERFAKLHGDMELQEQDAEVSHQTGLTPKELQELEKELELRLDKTEELVQQTVAARDMLSALLTTTQVQRRQGRGRGS